MGAWTIIGWQVAGFVRRCSACVGNVIAVRCTARSPAAQKHGARSFARLGFVTAVAPKAERTIVIISARTEPGVRGAWAIWVPRSWPHRPA
jgi:hypothetical protein